MTITLTDGREITGPIVHCKSCNAEIIWGKTVNDRNCPYSVEHLASHFADCVSRDQHKKPKP